MVTSQTKFLSFEEFLEWYPEDNKRYELIEGEYQMEKFVKGDRLKSSIFPRLELTVERVFQAGEE